MHNTQDMHNSSTHNCTQYMMCISLMAWVVTNSFEFPKFYRYPRVSHLPHPCLNNPDAEHPCGGRRYHAARRSRLNNIVSTYSCQFYPAPGGLQGSFSPVLVGFISTLRLNKLGRIFPFGYGITKLRCIRVYRFDIFQYALQLAFKHMFTFMTFVICPISYQHHNLNL